MKIILTGLNLAFVFDRCRKRLVLLKIIWYVGKMIKKNEQKERKGKIQILQ
jgi:hypothetical protein